MVNSCGDACGRGIGRALFAAVGAGLGAGAAALGAFPALSLADAALLGSTTIFCGKILDEDLGLDKFLARNIQNQTLLLITQLALNAILSAVITAGIATLCGITISVLDVATCVAISVLLPFSCVAILAAIDLICKRCDCHRSDHNLSHNA